ncbi:hypothetical protein G7054_g12947 [Neopestalotiopsis clavispora]|nr:hypothetical protein G7054_g12947 [Neopestalotiopsis clavispora]
MSGKFVPEELQSISAPTVSTAGPSKRGKGKYNQLDWDGHKAHLQDLYLVKNNSLVETMREMKERYAFEATARVFKDKFKQWGWQKNLPAKHAHFMVHKANNRKRKERKDTIFEYGGQRWDSKRAKNTLTRTKKTANDDNVIDMDTPGSIAYMTPTEEASTPTSSEPPEDSDDETVEVISLESEDEGDSQPRPKFENQNLLLSWQGLSRTDLDNMWRRGQTLAEQGRQSDSEELIQRARQGMRQVLGEVHEDTTKATYNLAGLYVLQGRSNEADSIIEEVTRKHVEILGFEDKKTQQHILHCISAQRRNDRDRRRKGSSNDKGKNALRSDLGSAATLSGSELPNIAENDASQINYYLDCATAHVQSKDNAVEHFLQAIIRQCQQYHPTLHIQYLRAWSELLKFYIAKNRVLDNNQAFANANTACADVLYGYRWEADKFESIEVMEAALQVASDILKGGHSSMAYPLFLHVSERAGKTFGLVDERNIWVLITIGIVYQRHLGWEQAQEWFESAFAGALSAFDPKDGILLSLQRAMDKKYFSYVSDEGRPFKTIFGISGVVIRPGRLHLD